MTRNQEINLDNYITPSRLVMIRLRDNCMFCNNPKGDSFIQYVFAQENMGYIHCDGCKKKAKKMVIFWTQNIAFGKANYLKNNEIKVKRSKEDIIDIDWLLDNPFTYINESGHELIHCCKKNMSMGKWCFVEDILRLNPPPTSSCE